MNADRRKVPTTPRDRQLIADLSRSEHMRGFVDYGLSRAENGTHPDYLRGREEYRQACISQVIAGDVA